ncbi:hypothetical protein BABINDRAFT_61055 [Babjeviella inositovora NRRL Y-12698]|uniref:THUMP domain-containing protein n=1 Tax=Babjeviella inositovora NRRL Y-12698 TaxID=984486 RepID=A0A1E3QT29_9ASCO|nr:uncharacterized protein BABINDRAFT_61055 [Babjeviella inositovora NRRL Y-12698]ODQ80865.1 hypothetical protein BABINDRAFT_61055 [Babjeviella inositovora NRRL Y-12698]
MAKRQASAKEGNSKKKYKQGGIVEPATSGIYATCVKGREQNARKELMNLLSDKVAEMYDLDNLEEEEEEEDLSIEDQINKELSEMKATKDTNKELLKPIELGCECVIFIKTRKPIAPEELVEKFVSELWEKSRKVTRYTQRLSPVTFSVTPTASELKKLSARVLAPHFHKPEGQEPVRYAIQVHRRNFDSLEKDAIIRSIAESVGRDHGHVVDLKNFDKLILVEAFKSNIGMSVVNNYNKYEKYNLQQIFEKSQKNAEDSTSRVRAANEGGATEEVKKDDEVKEKAPEEAKQETQEVK